MANKLEDHNYSGIDATIIADSTNEFGQRIVSYILTFPRIILAELNTHRMFSRNSASSRAIPFKKMVEKVKENPFIPIAWQKDHSGMQGKEYYSYPKDIERWQIDWLNCRDQAVESAEFMYSDGMLTKQLCNRLLEPFMWHTAIVTATEFENFFHLRCPQYETKDGVFRSQIDAVTASVLSDNEVASQYQNWSNTDWLEINNGAGEIHIMALAEKMWDAYNTSESKQLKAGEWHIPFGDSLDEKRIWEYLSNNITDFDLEDRVSHRDQLKYFNDMKIIIAVARCARVSYLNFEGKDDYSRDVELYKRLSSMGHWSPFEHVAVAMSKRQYNTYVSGKGFDHTSHAAHSEVQFDDDCKIAGQHLGWSGNFRGFVQKRKMFGGENKI